MKGISGVWQLILALAAIYFVSLGIAFLIGKAVEKWINDNIG